MAWSRAQRWSSWTFNRSLKDIGLRMHSTRKLLLRFTKYLMSVTTLLEEARLTILSLRAQTQAIESLIAPKKAAKRTHPVLLPSFSMLAPKVVLRILNQIRSRLGILTDLTGEASPPSILPSDKRKTPICRARRWQRTNTTSQMPMMRVMTKAAQTTPPPTESSTPNLPLKNKIRTKIPLLLGKSHS